MQKQALPIRVFDSAFVTWVLPALSLAGYIFFHYFVIRPDLCRGAYCVSNPGRFAGTPLFFYIGMFAVFLFMIRKSRTEKEINQMTVIGIIFRVAVIFSIPNYTDDFWRFLWDGRMTAEGINPYLFTPAEILEQSGLSSGTASLYREIFQRLNSPQYYTVYPPALQYVFGIAAICSPGIPGQVIVLKLFILLAEIGSLIFLKKLIREFSLSPGAILLYAVNPFVITELCGNLHFEALMICFMLGGLFFLTKGRLAAGAGFLSLAVGAKLLPLMFFPFILRRLGAKKFFIFCVFCAVFLVLIFLPLMGPKEFRGMWESLHLYFRCFEFNAGVYRLAKHFTDLGNVDRLQDTAGYVVGAIIILGALLERDRTWKGLAASWMTALGFYQLCAATIHPWYITPLSALCALSIYRWPVLWGFFLLLTYGFYYFPEFVQPAWAVGTEYVLLLLFIVSELIFRRRGPTLEQLIRRSPLFRSVYRRTLPRRLAIREGRLAKLLTPEGKLLDLGAGNGALCRALRKRGFDVTPVDVKDISFFPEVKPVVYDGSRLPFADQSFDTALLITILHHTPDPDAVLAEASRVARRLIVMEDIYRNRFQKYFTWFTDSLVNMEFNGHPHTNRNDAGWREAFRKMGKKVTYAEEFRTLLFFRQVIYVAE